jgi:hypothetical protein
MLVNIRKILVERLPLIEQSFRTAALPRGLDDQPVAVAADENSVARQFEFRGNADGLTAIVAEQLRLVRAFGS